MQRLLPVHDFSSRKRSRQAVQVESQEVLAAAEFGDATDQNCSLFVPF
jgi:hypothetical protein